MVEEGINMVLEPGLIQLISFSGMWKRLNLW